MAVVWWLQITLSVKKIRENEKDDYDFQPWSTKCDDTLIGPSGMKRSPDFIFIGYQLLTSYAIDFSCQSIVSIM